MDEAEKLKIARSEVCRQMAFGVSNKAITWDDLLSVAYVSVCETKTDSAALLRIAIRRDILNFVESEYVRKFRLFPCNVDALELHVNNEDHAGPVLNYEVLTRRELQAVYLSYWEELSEAEVGKAMGVTEGTASTLLSRARKKLAGSIKSKKFSPPVRDLPVCADNTNRGKKSRLNHNRKP
jgi:predicted DNA-binding protein (UPF0251 family)